MGTGGTHAVQITLGYPAPQQAQVGHGVPSGYAAVQDQKEEAAARPPVQITDEVWERVSLSLQAGAATSSMPLQTHNLQVLPPPSSPFRPPVTLSLSCGDPCSFLW